MKYVFKYIGALAVLFLTGFLFRIISIVFMAGWGILDVFITHHG